MTRPRPRPRRFPRLAVPVLIRLDASVLDHLTPLAELDLDEVVQFLGRTRKRFEAHVAEIGFHLAAVDDLGNLTVSTAGKSAQERSEWDDRFMRRVWLRLSSSSRAGADRVFGYCDR